MSVGELKTITNFDYFKSNLNCVHFIEEGSPVWASNRLCNSEWFMHFTTSSRCSILNATWIMHWLGANFGGLEELDEDQLKLSTSDVPSSICFYSVHSSCTHENTYQCNTSMCSQKIMEHRNDNVTSLCLGLINWVVGIIYVHNCNYEVVSVNRLQNSYDAVCLWDACIIVLT